MSTACVRVVGRSARAGALVLCAAAVLAACHRHDAGATSGAFPSLPDAGPGTAAPSRTELEVDGRRLVFEGGADEAVVATFTDGGHALTLSMNDPEGRLALVLGVRGEDGGAVQPGEHLAARCAGDGPCRWRGTVAALALPTPRDPDAPDGGAVFLAWDLPTRGLSPARLVIDTMEETVRPGRGPVRRLRGTFAGTFAAVAASAAGVGDPAVQGAVHRVSARFELDAGLR